MHMEEISNRALINLSFSMDSPLHLGAETEGTIKKVLLFKTRGRRTPIVPSESIKGVLRYMATSIAKSINWANEIERKVVESHCKDEHPGVQGLNEGEIDNLIKKVFGSREIELTDKEKRELYLSLNCPICRIFGSKEISGKLNITDGIIISRDQLENQEWAWIRQLIPKELGIRTYNSVSINRDTLTKEEERLFSLEYIEPMDDHLLNFRLVVDNILPRESDSILFSRLLRMVSDLGLWIGGAKSRGYGKLTLEDELSKVLLMDFREAKEAKQLFRILSLKDVVKLNIEEYCKLLEGGS